MRNSSSKRLRRVNRLAWIITPVLLMMVLCAGGFALFGAHASSPLNGRFAFRGITTTGPGTGLYLTGDLGLAVSGSTLTGTMCGFSVAPSHGANIDAGTAPHNLYVR